MISSLLYFLLAIKIYTKMYYAKTSYCLKVCQSQRQLLLVSKQTQSTCAKHDFTVAAVVYIIHSNARVSDLGEMINKRINLLLYFSRFMFFSSLYHFNNTSHVKLAGM